MRKNVRTGRRRFLAKAGGAVVVAAAAVADVPNVIAQPKFRWRMPTTWPPALDVLQGSPSDWPGSSRR
jgi:TRAP-type mannitol/chloroaromatic compound transport system substrate-binding protein